MTLNEFKEKYDLIELNNLESLGIFIDLRYALADNFVGKVVYPDTTCLIRKEVGEALKLVAKDLREYGYGILIWDAFRSQKVQELFWEFLPDPTYIVDPKIGSAHTKGSKVDVGLVILDSDNEKGYRLAAMPTKHDCFTKEAHVVNVLEKEKKHMTSFPLLLDCMKKHNFKVLPTEWWDYEFDKEFSLIKEDYDREIDNPKVKKYH